MPDQSIVSAFIFLVFGGVAMLTVTAIIGLTVFVFVLFLNMHMLQFKEIAQGERRE